MKLSGSPHAENSQPSLDYLRRGEYPRTGCVKFAVFKSGEDQERDLLVFNVGTDHIRRVTEWLAVKELDAKTHFIGAGAVEDKHVGWDSDTCKAAFGYDRPQDKEQRDAMLQEVRDVLSTWLEVNLKGLFL